MSVSIARAVIFLGRFCALSKSAARSYCGVKGNTLIVKGLSETADIEFVREMMRQALVMTKRAGFDYGYLGVKKIVLKPEQTC
jgi:hypothetical protein